MRLTSAPWPLVDEWRAAALQRAGCGATLPGQTAICVLLGAPPMAPVVAHS